MLPQLPQWKLAKLFTPIEDAINRVFQAGCFYWLKIIRGELTLNRMIINYCTFDLSI